MPSCLRGGDRDLPLDGAEAFVLEPGARRVEVPLITVGMTEVSATGIASRQSTPNCRSTTEPIAHVLIGWYSAWHSCLMDSQISASLSDARTRISPVEPYFVGDQLVLGAMAWSGKAADLLRDPRHILHSTVTGPDTGEGELKLYGSAA